MSDKSSERDDPRTLAAQLSGFFGSTPDLPDVVRKDMSDIAFRLCRALDEPVIRAGQAVRYCDSCRGTGVLPAGTGGFGPNTVTPGLDMEKDRDEWQRKTFKARKQRDRARLILDEIVKNKGWVTPEIAERIHAEIANDD